MLRKIWMVLGAIALASFPPVAALTVGEVHTLLPAEVASRYYLGSSVSVSGHIAVVGAPSETDNGINSGSAFVFVRDNNGSWVEDAKLLASDGAFADRFGYAVSVSDDTAAICAPGERPRDLPGAAYVFIREADDTWREQAKLELPDETTYVEFCSSVSISGDTVVVGTPWDDENAYRSGAAYVFVRDAQGIWSEQAKLLASDGAEEDLFGVSVSVSGDTVVVGTNVDYWADYPGAAYVFVRDGDGGWTEQAKLLASDGELHDQFGWSVSVSGDTVLVSSPWDQDNGYESGSAYVFIRDVAGVWSEQAKLLASDGVRWEEFGASVSVSGVTAVVGAIGSRYDDTGFWTGSVYVFVRDLDGVWAEQTQLLATGEPAHDEFGWSVSLSEGTVVAGAANRSDDPLCSPHVFTFAPTIWGEADKETLTWDAMSTALSYTVYRGILSTLVDTDADGLPDSGYGECMNHLDIDPTDLEFVDPEIPNTEGDGFFYVVGFIDPSGATGLGNTSTGLRREPLSVCP